MAGQPLGGGGDKENQRAVIWGWGWRLEDGAPSLLTPHPRTSFHH